MYHNTDRWVSARRRLYGRASSWWRRSEVEREMVALWRRCRRLSTSPAAAAAADGASIQPRDLRMVSESSEWRRRSRQHALCTRAWRCRLAVRRRSSYPTPLFRQQLQQQRRPSADQPDLWQHNVMYHTSLAITQHDLFTPNLYWCLATNFSNTMRRISLNNRCIRPRNNVIKNLD